jgi:hypothetical protein
MSERDQEMKQMKRVRNPAKLRRLGLQPVESDELLDAALEQHRNIVMAYDLFEELRPVIVLDIQDQEIRAMRYQDLREDLNERSQHLMDLQYKQAQVDGQIVVYVQDAVKRKFRSYSLSREPLS